MESLLNALDTFKERKVIVVGDILLDKSVIGTAKERMNPERVGVPLISVKKVEYRLGGAANVARNVASLGASCYLFGQIGKDYHGEKIKELCAAEGIKTFLIYPGRQTIVKERLFVDGDYSARIDFGEENLGFLDYQKELDLEIGLSKEIDSCNLILFSDYNKGVFKGGLARRIIQEIKDNKRKILTLVDPKPANIGNFWGCDILRPNRKEAEEIAGIKNDNENNLRDIALKLTEKVNSKYLAITCGGEGAFAYDREKNRSEFVPTKRVTLADVIGAGDTFAAALGLGFSSDLLDFGNSVKLANYASAVVVGKMGTSVTTDDELREAIKQEEG